MCGFWEKNEWKKEALESENKENLKDSEKCKAAPEEQMWALWFTSVPGIGRKTLYGLEKKFGSLKRAASATEEELASIMKASQIRSLREFESTPDRLMRQCARAGVRYVTVHSYSEAETELALGHRKDAVGSNCNGAGSLYFPERLRQIPDSPYGLFVKGRLPDPDQPTVAIIGARVCSGYGKEAARLMGAAAAAAGIQVISGMARGVDSISQTACLEAGGTSFGVLGSGVDVCYPAEARSLYERLAKEGGIISEYPLGAQPVAGNFPPRNRLISGLADLVLVIEARERSGTLITVDMALEQGREVAVLPGRITDALSQGCYGLYEQGAYLVTSPERMAELVWESFTVGHEGRHTGRGFHTATGERSGNNPGKVLGFSGTQLQVLELLDLTPQPAERLYQLFQENGGKESLPEFLAVLMDLELAGECESVGAMYVKKERISRKEGTGDIRADGV
ncbi:MAG: DNA-processing protein DprA [Lachnospiraceae bacterium]|nr:DNA-processing protein DprA [Lachnospiraceae bacterium]